MMINVARWRGALVMVSKVLRMRGAASPKSGMFGCRRIPNGLGGVAVGDGVAVSAGGGVGIGVEVGRGVAVGVSV